MEQSGFIVSVDFGTSKIVGVLARKSQQGIISILASETLPSDACIKYGVIYNTKEAAGKLKKIISLLENKVGKKIGKIYVSVAGKSLRAIEHQDVRHMDGHTEVRFADIDSMEQQAKLNKPDFFTNYSVLSPEYYLDGEYVDEPIGKTPMMIEGKYRLVVGRPNIKNNISKVVSEIKYLDVAGFVVGPVASATLMLDDADRDEGCVLIDFGAGTTTLSIYKDGFLRYMSVIPFGGRTITKDVQALGFSYESAESYKVRFGRVGKQKVKLTKGNVEEVDVRELNKVIQLRQDEIILNIMNQINLSGYAGKLKAGITVIGGASLLSGLNDYLEEKTQMKVKTPVPERVYINNASDMMQDPTCSQVLGLLLFANENCERKEVFEPKPEEVKVETPKAQAAVEPEAAKEPKKKKTSIFDRLQNFGGTLFTEE